MAIYLKWYMCPCHEPLVAQISICSNTFGRVEYIYTVYITKLIIVCKFVYQKYLQSVCTESNVVVNYLKIWTQIQYLEIVNLVVFFRFILTFEIKGVSK